MTYETVADMVSDLHARPIESGGHVYHPIPFPEFASLRSSANEAAVEAKGRRVLGVIDRRRSMGLPSGRVLDIGANGGYFTFSLARTVDSVTAYEPTERYSAIGQTLARLRAPNVDWRGRPFSEAEIGAETWDVALMLSTFQWITAGDERLEEGRELLRALSSATSCLIFEIGLNHGKSAVTTSKLNHISAVYRLLRDSTTYPTIRYAGSARVWPNKRRWKARRHMFVCSHDDPGFPEARAAIAKHIDV
jgi:SAM-dependent methyltransferase